MRSEQTNQTTEVPKCHTPLHRVVADAACSNGGKTTRGGTAREGKKKKKILPYRANFTLHVFRPCFCRRRSVYMHLIVVENPIHLQ